jgi:hypothetical protein
MYLRDVANSFRRTQRAVSRQLRHLAQLPFAERVREGREPWNRGVPTFEITLTAEAVRS